MDNLWTLSSDFFDFFWLIIFKLVLFISHWWIVLIASSSSEISRFGTFIKTGPFGSSGFKTGGFQNRPISNQRNWNRRSHSVTPKLTQRTAPSREVQILQPSKRSFSRSYRIDCLWPAALWALWWVLRSLRHSIWSAWGTLVWAVSQWWVWAVWQEFSLLRRQYYKTFWGRYNKNHKWEDGMQCKGEE